MHTMGFVIESMNSLSVRTLDIWRQSISLAFRNTAMATSMVYDVAM